MSVCRRVFISVGAWILVGFAETGRNGRNGPVWFGIHPEVEQRGISFRFACWHSIFRPFQLEPNGTNNIAMNSYQEKNWQPQWVCPCKPMNYNNHIYFKNHVLQLIIKYLLSPCLELLVMYRKSNIFKGISF